MGAAAVGIIRVNMETDGLKREAVELNKLRDVEVSSTG